MKRYTITHSEDRIYTTLHDGKADLSFTVLNLDPATSIVPVYLKSWWNNTYSVCYHVKNMLRITWFQRRKKLV